MKRSSFLLLALFCFVWSSVATTVAQDKYPSKPIKIIVPLIAGTVNDVVARIVSETLSKDLCLLGVAAGGGCVYSLGIDSFFMALILTAVA